jgi:hypothetical protein
MDKILDKLVEPFILIGSSLIIAFVIYGLFDLASKKACFLFILGIFFPTYALIQGIGALLNWW